MKFSDLTTSLEMTPIELTDREMSEFMCKGHESAVVRLPDQTVQLICKHCHKKMSTPVEDSMFSFDVRHGAAL